MTEFRFDSKEAVNYFFKEHGVGKSLYYDRKNSGRGWNLAKTANLVHVTRTLLDALHGKTFS